MSFIFDHDSFHGPLDLLLYLVKKSEVEILDIPISRITDQFLEYLPVLRAALDLDQVGEFISMAATLAEIKSRMLLPQEPVKAEKDEPDPRRELVKQLLEYRKFKDAAANLEERAEKQAERVPRVEAAEPLKQGPTVKPVELWDLVSAFARLMRETKAIETATITVDDTPQHVYEEQIRNLVKERGRVPFRDLFTPPFIKSRLIGLFLAVLELIKVHGVWLEQPEDFGDIWLTSPPEGMQPPELQAEAS
jgi:segregation and condensation protein A